MQRCKCSPSKAPALHLAACSDTHLQIGIEPLNGAPFNVAGHDHTIAGNACAAWLHAHVLKATPGRRGMARASTGATDPPARGRRGIPLLVSLLCFAAHCNANRTVEEIIAQLNGAALLGIVPAGTHVSLRYAMLSSTAHCISSVDHGAPLHRTAPCRLLQHPPAAAASCCRGWRAVA